MDSRQLEAIKLKIADIKAEVNAEDKKELVANGICSMGTIDTYVTKGDAKDFTLANKIYKFLNKRVEYRFKQLNK
jgi:hypothetical protein